jgi:hypothetical protein
VRSKDRLEPLLSSYRFPTAAAATKFIDEAILAMEYLGCTAAAFTDADRA